MAQAFQTDTFQTNAFEAGGAGTTAPTAVTGVDLVAGTGTRSFTAQTTQAADWLVVSIQVENSGTSSTFPPTATGITFGAAQVDSGTAANTAKGRALIFAGQDSTGASRTVTITPAGGAAATLNYRARLTVVRGSAGPGTGKAATDSAQTASITRQGDHSMILMGTTDWSGGAVGSPSWTPGGSTVASELQSGIATYIFGRWDDSGAAGTASHGISSPSYTTPAVAVLEMLGTASSAPAPPWTPLMSMPVPG